MASHVRHAFHGRARRTLRLGAGAAALASSLLLAPGGALAKDHCAGLTGAGCTLTAPVLASAAPVAVEALPQDLTLRRSPMQAAGSAQAAGVAVTPAGAAALAPRAQGKVMDPTIAKASIAADDVVVEEGTVVKMGDNTPGISTIANGTTTVRAGSVTTDGSVSTGIRTEGYGQINIDVGTVETSGWRSDGIFATTNLGGATGGIAITADSIKTSGDFSNAVTATSYRGDVTIDVGQVKATGYASGGIYANAGQGNATVNAGTVETSGDSSRGLVAYSNGATKVVVDSVTTAGGGAFQDANAGAIIAVGTSVEIHAGNVTTQGEYSDGIYATSNFVYDNGQASHDIAVTAGSVSTAGDHAAGIVAINVLGDNHIDVGTVKTIGDYATGVYAVSVYGNTNIKAGDVSTAGFTSSAVEGKAIFGGDVNIDVGKVTTTGDESTGVLGVAYYGNVSIKAGEVSTLGMQSSGIVAIAGDGTATVNSSGVTTVGMYSDGIQAFSGGATGGVAITNTGTIHVSGFGSDGINVISNGGPIRIDNPGAIQVDGMYGVGIYALQTAGNGIIDINAGDVKTTGFAGAGIIALGLDKVDVDFGNIVGNGNGSLGIVAISNGGGDVSVKGGNIDVLGIGMQVATDGNMSIDVGNVYGSFGGIFVEGSGDVAINAGNVVTSSQYGAGIDVRTGGAVTIRADNLLTDAEYSTGIEVRAASADIHMTGSLYTHGYGSRGVLVHSYSGDTKVRIDGKVYTEGYASTGVYAGGSGNVSIEVGEVHTAIYDRSAGIIGFSSAGDVSAKSKVVTTEGADSIGIYAGIRDIYGTGFTGDITISAGKVSTWGADSVGLMGLNFSTGGGVTIEAGEVSTRRERAMGIYALAFNGSATVTAGTVSTLGAEAHGIYANVEHDATVTAGAVSTKGDRAIGIIASSFDNSKIVVGTVETSGLFSAGVAALAGLEDKIGASIVGKVDIAAGKVTTHGNYSAGVIGFSKWGDVSIKAGSVTTNGRSSEGISAGNVAGKITIAANSISTTGDKSNGIGLGAENGEVQITVGNISTEGDDSAGIRTFTTGVDQTITVDNVKTSGERSWGILAHSVRDDITIKVNGTVTVSGADVAGIRTNTSMGHVKIDAANVVTTGDKSAGVYSFLVGSAGIRSADIKVGSITTSGANANGIHVYNREDGIIAYGGDVAAAVLPAAGEVGPSVVPVVASMKPAVHPERGTLTLPPIGKRQTNPAAGPITASNWVRGDGTRDIVIEAGKIDVSGTGAMGIFVDGSGRVTTKVGSVKAAGGSAINIQAYEENTLSVSGSVTSAKESSEAIFLKGSDIKMTFTSGAKVSGDTGVSAIAVGPKPDVWDPNPGLPEDPGIGIGIALDDAPVAPEIKGTVRIENAGSIKGTANAISVAQGVAVIENKGVIDGKISTAEGADTILNSGVWTFGAHQSSDFGLGTDVLINSGIVTLSAAGKAGKAKLAELDRFENSGTISLQNGVAGDTLTLPGNYIASGKAKLGIDIGGNGKIADMFVVEGAATGSTSISLVSTDGYSATLLGGPLRIVTVGAGSSADAFKLESTDIGFVRYGLTYDAASRSYSVLSTAGAPVYRFARLNEGAQAIWLKSAEAFTGHMRSSRDLGDPGKRIWGQMSGGVANRDETRSVAGGNGFAAASYDLDYRQDFYGGELGFDAVQGDGVTAGVMAGYTSSTQRFKANGDRGRTDALNVGAYGGVTKGVFFANLLVKYDSFSTRVSSQQMDWDDKIDGHSIGAQGELGARLGSAKFFVEPTASLAWQSTSIGDIEALDQTIAFDKASGLRGRIGARLGGVAKLGGTELTFYGAGDFVHEFKGDDGATLVSGGQRVWVPGARMDDYGQATLGLDIKGSGPVSGFIQGSGTFGSSYSGVDGRAGIRFTF